MNTLTAIATFLTVLHAGYSDAKILYKEGVIANVEPTLRDLVFKNRIRNSVKNAIYLGLGAFFVTNQIPSAFELSVATFELIIFLSPYTLDKLILNKPKLKTNLSQST